MQYDLTAAEFPKFSACYTRTRVETRPRTAGDSMCRPRTCATDVVKHDTSNQRVGSIRFLDCLYVPADRNDDHI